MLKFSVKDSERCKEKERGGKEEEIVGVGEWESEKKGDKKEKGE